MAAGNEMRVSDAEREAAAAELRDHFASGRLDQEELDQRLTGAFAAKTRADLNALFTDLPARERGWTGAGAQSGGRPSSGGPFGGGPFGPGSFGARAGEWGRSGAPGDGTDWQARGDAFRASLGRRIGQVVLTSVLIWVLFIVGILGVFGIGATRPLGIVLLIAAVALLRRVFFMIFGRRRGHGRAGRRGRC